MKSADAGAAPTLECPLFFPLVLGALSMVAVAALRSFLFMVFFLNERRVSRSVQSLVRKMRRPDGKGRDSSLPNQHGENWPHFVQPSIPMCHKTRDRTSALLDFLSRTIQLRSRVFTVGP